MSIEVSRNHTDEHSFHLARGTLIPCSCAVLLSCKTPLQNVEWSCRNLLSEISVCKNQQVKGQNHRHNLVQYISEDMKYVLENRYVSSFFFFTFVWVYVVSLLKLSVTDCMCMRVVNERGRFFF